MQNWLELSSFWQGAETDHFGQGQRSSLWASSVKREVGGVGAESRSNRPDENPWIFANGRDTKHPGFRTPFVCLEHP